MATSLPTVRLIDDENLDATAAARLTPRGWTLRPGFELPASPWDLSGRRWTCFGEVADRAGAAAAVAALARGVGLVIVVGLTGDDRRRFQEDLVRIGRVVGPVDASHDLGPDHDALLEGLASGLSVTAAATRANLSRRTANRRLAEVRSRFGVASTAEAVTRWSGRPDPEGQSER